MSKRSERRHHKERMKKKAERIVDTWNYDGSNEKLTLQERKANDVD